MNPITLGLSGVGLLSGFLGKKKKPKPRKMNPFSYTQNQNDPELQLLRSRFLEDSSRASADLTNEIGRAGLLGTSTSFDLLRNNENSKLRGLEGIDESLFARRRAEALDQYNREADRNFQLDLLDKQDYLNSENNRLDILGQLGGILGSEFGLDHFDKLSRLKQLDSFRSILEDNGGYMPFPLTR